jgi:Chaperone of endosialidase
MKSINITPTTNNSKSWSLLRRTLLLILLALACFRLLPGDAFGVVPAPDGGYPGFNTAEGENALFSLTSGVGNTAVGWHSLFSNTDGSSNTGVGAGTLLFNVGDQNAGDGVGNTAIGTAALLFNTRGSLNTAVGTQALLSNTAGSLNTAVGSQALPSNTTGSGNTAMGEEALLRNTTGFDNTATGSAALFRNTDGSSNTANGRTALLNNINGNNNTAIGQSALYYSTGNGNTALGANAGNSVTTANNVIAIGTGGANVSDSCYIGKIFGATIEPTSALNVMIDSSGKLGTTARSKRFKEEIQPMGKASETILALRPVTFRYKSYKNSPLQFGLIAEEVADVNPDLVARDKNGEIYTVRYDQINAMLLNEFLKQHRKVEEQGRRIEEQEVTIAQLKQEIATVVAYAKQQDSKIQEIKTQIEMSKSAPQIVVNP